MTETLGHVAALWRYPVKSMAGEPLDRAHLGRNGLAGDRRWGFLHPHRSRSGFPWLTLRDDATLARYRPRVEDPQRPDRSSVAVRTPSGAELDVTDPALAAELGATGGLLKLDRGTFDTLPVSLISRASIDALAARVGRPLELARFRPNIVLDVDAPFTEDTWVGATLTLGDARLRIDARDQRCVVITLDPHTGERDPTILKTLGAERDTCLGVYGTVITPGELRVGDPITRASESPPPPP